MGDLSPNRRLRSAEKADHEAIRALVHGARLNPLGLDWRRFIVVEGPQGELLACGQVKPHRDGSKELASLVVEEQHRGQGLGGIIVKRLMNQHGQPLYLMCRSTLTSYYTRFGFLELTPEMEQPPYFKRIRRLFGTLVDRFRGDDSYLAVMVWPGDSPEA
ncbi:MAG: GNAT family N-acetyltransferase [Anaerolineales bacterium]|jgi:N-acetylglutamate synthase-like GNAT family acetyltransferase